MESNTTLRRVTYVILCTSPLLIAPLTGIRALRIPVVYEVVRVLLFGTIALCGWWLARPRSSSPANQNPQAALAGALFLIPFSLIALFWVGLGTPWDATPPENAMRYAVLLIASIAVTAAFVVLKEALTAAGEILYSALGFALSILSGAAYVVWTSFQLGDHSLRAALGQVSPAVASMNNVFDSLLFAAGALAYLATAAFAHALNRTRWLGQKASIAYVVLNMLALTFLLLRGLSFPDPTRSATPWYTRPGFIVDIPAVPWLMPFFLGVGLLRRSGTTPA